MQVLPAIWRVWPVGVMDTLMFSTPIFASDSATPAHVDDLGFLLVVIDEIICLVRRR